MTGFSGGGFPGRRVWKRLAAALVAAAIGAALWFAAPWCVEAPALPQPPDARVEDRHGAFLGLVPGRDLYRCQPLPEGEPLSENLVRALLAAEDKRFFSHGGIDPAAIVRALWQRLVGGTRSGASTLTMQLAKLGNGPAPRTWSSKIRESLQARRLEMQNGKEELLRAYLNAADFGNLCRGAEAASLFYFGKPARSLSLPEAALLAAVVKAPSRLDPLQRPEAALARRNGILSKLGAPTDAPLGARACPLNAPAHLADSPGRLTLDAGLQADAAAIAREELQRLRRRNVSQAAVVVIDNRSGELLVSLPAACPESPRGGRLNGAAVPRSAGSALKPFVYLLAFQNGAWPGTILADVPTLYRSPDGIQAPGNYDNRYLGPVTIRQALACSQNVPAMEALNRYGGVDSLLSLLRRLGFAVQGDKAEYGLGLAIGNAHVTLTELTRAYSILARNGARLPLQTRLPLQPAQEERLLNAVDCYRIADILSDPAARAAGFGPALRFPFRCAVKTGTSSNFRDNWCIGFTGDYTVGVWVGNFDNTPMHRISGVSGAGPIFRRLMERLYRDGKPAAFPPEPDGIEHIVIDARTGARAAESVPASCRAVELATAQDLLRLPPGNYDENGRALLDARYAEWYAHAGQESLYALDPAAPGDRRPAILIPAPGSVVTLDPSLPRKGRFLELRSTLPETSSWNSRTLPVIRRNGHWYAILRPGAHTLRVTAPDGRQAESSFHVEEL